MKCAFRRCEERAKTRGLCKDHYKRIFGDRPAPENPLKAYRDKKGWTQEELASALGVSVRSLREWEHKSHAPRFATLMTYGLEFLEMSAADSLSSKRRTGEHGIQDEAV